MKLLFTFLLAMVTVTTFAQKDFQGKAYYFSKTTVDMNNFGRPGMSEDQKKQISERMKSMLEKTFILTFNQSESIYKEEDTVVPRYRLADLLKGVKAIGNKY